MNNTQLLAASNTITIHTLDSEYPNQQYNPHNGIVNSAVFNHTGKVIGSCGQDSKISLHNAQKCQDKLLEFSYHSPQEEPSSVNCFMFSPKSKFMAAGAANSTVKIWEIKGGKEKDPIKKLKGSGGSITSISWLQGERFLATSSAIGDIFIYDVMTGGIRDTLCSNIEGGINTIKVSETESFRRLAACTNGGSLMVWDLHSNIKKPYYSYEDPHKRSFTSLSISSLHFACSSLDKSLTLFNINQKKVAVTLSTSEPLTSVSFNDDGLIIAAGGINGSIMIYDIRRLTRPFLKLLGHDTPIKSICLEKKREGTRNEDPIESQINNNPTINNTSQQQQIFVPNIIPSNISPHISRPSTQTTYTAQISQPTISQSSENTKEKLYAELNNMEMRMNEKFEALHLEVIRQNQISVEKIMKGFEKNQIETQQLEERIKLLEIENENLRKRTF